MRRRFFHTTNRTPPIPPEHGVMGVDVLNQTGRARVSLRQTNLEAGVAGVGRAMCWMFMVRQVNQDLGFKRVWSNELTAAGDAQWTFAIRDFAEAGANNQLCQFSIFTNATNLITIRSSKRLLRQRWHKIGINWNGIDENGLELWIDGVVDSGATKIETGTFTGPLNNTALRMCIGSTFVTAQRFGGYLRDQVIMHRQATSAEMLEYFNTTNILAAGEPYNVMLSSFSADIISYKSLSVNLLDVVNTSYNYGNDVGITFEIRHVSTKFPSFTCLNARISNTRYIAFNGALSIDGIPKIWIRDGTDHTSNGVIDLATFNITDLLAATPVTWNDAILSQLPEDLRSLQVGVIDGKIFGFTSTMENDDVTFQDAGRYESTDGLTGLTFGSWITMATPGVGVSLNFYGNVVPGDNAGEYFIPYHEYTVGAQNICLWKTTDDGATWTKQVCFSGTTEGYNEFVILRVAPSTYVGLVRTATSIRCTISLDNCATWSAPVATNLSVGIAMAAMCLEDEDNIVVFYADRGDGFAKISRLNLISDILSTPGTWQAGSVQFKTLQGGNNILGYPFILNLGGGLFAGGISSEASSTRSDFFGFYGAFGAG